MEFIQPAKDSLLTKIIEIIEANLSDEHFGVSDLAREMGMSRSNLHRKVKAITNITISQLVRRIRLQKALELLRESSMTISEVAIESGFSSQSYFTNCFTEYYGVPPSKFRLIEGTVKDPYKDRKPQGKKGKRAIKTANVWIIVAPMTIISAMILILLLSPNIRNPFIKDKTVAVLPYGGNDQVKGDAFLVDGLMNEIRYKLSLIEDLTVSSRTSVERYRNTDKPIKEIGKELNVNYILECSAEIIQGRTWIELQLLDAENGKQLWSEPYLTEISLNNIFRVQKEAAQAVTKVMRAELVLEEKEQMERIPTENLAAYNLFLLGRNYVNISIYSPDKKSSNQAIFKAKWSFEQAIRLDSTFADAYAALGSLYINNLYFSQLYRDIDKAKINLDSGLVMLDKALFYDSVNLEALQYKAAYFERIGQQQDANQIYEKLPATDELTYMHYHDEVMRFSHVEDYYVEDYYGAVESYQKYLQLKPEEIIVPPYMLRTMMWVFRQAGYPELDKQIAKQLLEFNNDSVEYFRNMVSSEIVQGNFRSALHYAMETIRLAPESTYCNWLVALSYLWLDDFTNAHNYLVISENLIKQNGGRVRPQYLSGYIYLMNGDDSEANYHFQGALNQRQREIEYATPQSRLYYTHLYLAVTYLALGDEKTSLEYLNDLKMSRDIDYGVINILINWSGFESIRKSSEFQGVIEHLIDKYQKQYKRIGNLIEDLELEYL